MQLEMHLVKAQMVQLVRKPRSAYALEFPFSNLLSKQQYIIIKIRKYIGQPPGSYIHTQCVIDIEYIGQPSVFVRICLSILISATLCFKECMSRRRLCATDLAA